MTDSSVLVTSVRAAFPGFDDRTGKEPMEGSSCLRGPGPLLAASQVRPVLFLRELDELF